MWRIIPARYSVNFQTMLSRVWVVQKNLSLFRAAGTRWTLVITVFTIYMYQYMDHNMEQHIYQDILRIIIWNNIYQDISRSEWISDFITFQSFVIAQQRFLFQLSIWLLLAWSDKKYHKYSFSSYITLAISQRRMRKHASIISEVFRYQQQHLHLAFSFLRMLFIQRYFTKCPIFQQKPSDPIHHIFLSHLYGLLSFRLKYQHFRSIKCQATTYHLQLYWSKQKS